MFPSTILYVSTVATLTIAPAAAPHPTGSKADGAAFTGCMSEPEPPTGTPADPKGHLERRVIEMVARHPGWDGEQIADALGEDAFTVLDVIATLVEQGIVGHKA